MIRLTDINRLSIESNIVIYIGKQKRTLEYRIKQSKTTSETTSLIILLSNTNKILKNQKRYVNRLRNIPEI